MIRDATKETKEHIHDIPRVILMRLVPRIHSEHMVHVYRLFSSGEAKPSPQILIRLSTTMIQCGLRLLSTIQLYTW